MNSEPMEDDSHPLLDVVRKIIVWIIVFFLAFMLIATVLFQPDFFTFIN